MTIVINPFLETSSRDYFESTKHRFFSMARPVQQTSKKESDVMAYIATPIIDIFILEPIFVFEAAIHLLNATASLARAVYLWTLNQQTTASFYDEGTIAEIKDAHSSIIHASSALVAQNLNAVLSLLSLVTRPVASIMHELLGEHESNMARPQTVQYPAHYSSPYASAFNPRL